jgi:NhaP-type Na+/H+ and K+/H+ antiporter
MSINDESIIKEFALTIKDIQKAIDQAEKSIQEAMDHNLEQQQIAKQKIEVLTEEEIKNKITESFNKHYIINKPALINLADRSKLSFNDRLTLIMHWNIKYAEMKPFSSDFIISDLMSFVESLTLNAKHFNCICTNCKNLRMVDEANPETIREHLSPRPRDPSSGGTG